MHWDKAEVERVIIDYLMECGASVDVDTSTLYFEYTTIERMRPISPAILRGKIEEACGAQS